MLVLLAGCNLVGGSADQTVPTRSAPQTAAFASFQVTATILNVRQEPTAQAIVIAQIGGGTTVVPKRVSGTWYGIEMPDGGIGWVHSDFLSLKEE